MADFYKDLENSELVLVGLGEEFDGSFSKDNTPGYDKIKEQLSDCGRFDLIPIAQELYRGEQEKKICDALNHFAGILDKKNYFIVSTSLNPVLNRIKWRDNRIVKPCGDLQNVQCIKGCDNIIEKISDDTLFALKNQWKEADDRDKNASYLIDCIEKMLGKCSNCASSMIFNTIYADNYNEAGYLTDWKTYMTWLQGTIHKSVMILELGVSMKYPSVIRFPFEKVAFYNAKSKFYRVNEKLYHMTEELHDKGVSIKENACDWLLSV